MITNTELKKRRSRNTPSVLTGFSEWRSKQRGDSIRLELQNFRKDYFERCFQKGTDFINVFIKMVAKELKMPPDEIRQWSLTDLIDIVSEILSQNDQEIYSFYFEK